MKQNDIEIKTDIEHLLLVPEMYIGSMSLMTDTILVLDNNKFVYKDITYVHALFKIFQEIVDNSLDEFSRTNGKYSTKIDITITEKSVEITDNGRGIPVKKIEGTNIYQPRAAFTMSRAGSNFQNKSSKKEIGTHGVGSFACNVFSKVFEVITDDGISKYKLICKDNLSSIDEKILKSSKQGTAVYFEPDLEKFNLKKIDDVYTYLMENRLHFLSMCYPGIKFTLNGNKIKTNTPVSFIKMINPDYELIEKDNYFIAITPSLKNDFSSISYVNGLSIRSGNHIDYITSEVVGRLREKLDRRHKGIKPGDIKNKIQIIMFMNHFPDMKFSSQTKEQLTNSFPSIREYLQLDNDELDKFVDKIYKNKVLIDDITETFRVKEELKKRQELKDMSKTNKKLNIEKYLPPAKKNTYLVLCEGDSAVGGVSKVLGRDEFGYFALRGKPLNVFNAPVSKIKENKEWYHIIQILGLYMTDENTNMDFENVLIATDADLDGILIRGLILTFFEKFAPKLVHSGRIKILSTPMITAVKKGNIEDYFMSFEDYSSHQKKNKGFEYNFYKGLGTWKGKEDLGLLIEKRGLDSFISSFEHDDKYVKILESWMSNECSDERKAYLRDKEFNIFKI